MDLRGRKVRLRPFERPDLDALLRWRNDPEVTEFLSTLEMSRAEADLWYWRYIGSPTALFFTIEVDGKAIGCVGVRNIDHHAGTGVLDIVIGEKEYWGRGYGGDAVETIVRHVFAEQHLRRVSLEVLPFNERAIRAYQRSGFRVTGTNPHEVYYRRGRRWQPLEMMVTAEEFKELETRA